MAAQLVAGRHVAPELVFPEPVIVIDPQQDTHRAMQPSCVAAAASSNLWHCMSAKLDLEVSVHSYVEPEASSLVARLRSIFAWLLMY
jgi:hypothetical protein